MNTALPEPVLDMDFRSRMLADAEVVIKRVSVTIRKGKVTASRAELSADIIPVWPDNVEEILVWRLRTFGTTKRRAKKIRFDADDFQPIGPWLHFRTFE